MEPVIRDFLDFLSTEKDFSANTVAAYKNDVNQFASFVKAKAAGQGSQSQWLAVDRSLILRYVLNLKEDRGYALATAARKVAAIRSFFNFLLSRGVLKTDPTEGLSLERVEKPRPKTLSVQEVDELLRQPAKLPTPEAKRDKAMLESLYATGMQVSELVSLNMDDINLQAGFVRCLGRGSRERVIPIHQRTVQTLSEYLKEGRPRLLRQGDEKALFLNRRGERLTRQGFWLILKGYAKEAKVNKEITSRVLRHSIATHLLHSRRMTLRELQEFLGHANISTTQTYSRLGS